MFEFMDATFWAALLGIIWIDLLLSGDNAVVIALVCRQLPEKQQKIGMVLGSGLAVGLRIVFAFFISWLLAVPFLSIVGGLFLLYVAVKMIDLGEEEHGEHKPSATLWGAMATIAIADAGMSLDNVMAIAALSHGSLLLMALGILISIPMVIAGSALVSTMVTRFPVLVLAGAALLGWVAGGIIAHDPFVITTLGLPKDLLGYTLSGTGLAVILGTALIKRFTAPAVA